jgi:RNA polymerase primary sigma factor
MALIDDGDSSAMRELRRQARAFQPLESGEEMRLLERSALGDRSSESRLVAANLRLIIRLAEARDDRGLSVADLVQEGSLGLVEAVRTFAASGQHDFGVFAERKVGEQMEAALAAEAAAVRDAELLVAAATDYERAELVLARELHREPAVAEIAEKLEWTVERATYVRQVVADARRRHDEELLSFIDPDAIDLDQDEDDERAEFDA